MHLPAHLDKRNCLSFWFPKLRATGVPVPVTEMVHGPEGLIELLDGKEPRGFDAFIVALNQVALEMGLPCFLRTGRASGKHQWGQTCFVGKLSISGKLLRGEKVEWDQRDPLGLTKHVRALVEFSELAAMPVGLPYDVWAIREFLPTHPEFVVFAGMPMVSERRYFISNGAVVDHIPYWPEDAIEFYGGVEPPKDWRNKLRALNHQKPEEVKLLTGMSELISRAFDGSWSLDWMLCERGWVAIDMAMAECSWGCPESLGGEREKRTNPKELSLTLPAKPLKCARKEKGK